MARGYVVEVQYGGGGGWSTDSGPWSTRGEAEDARDRSRTNSLSGFNENVARFNQELGASASQYAGHIQSIRERQLSNRYRIREVDR